MAGRRSLVDHGRADPDRQVGWELAPLGQERFNRAGLAGGKPVSDGGRQARDCRDSI